MATWRATLFFEFRRYSWSETYHYKLANAALDAVRLAAVNLAKAHLNLMGAGDDVPSSPRIPYIRISDDEVRRDSYLINELAGSKSSYNGLHKEAVQPWDVLELRGEIDSGLRRKIWYVSCAPTEIYNNPAGIFNLQGSDWNNRYAAFVGEVLANWALHYELPPNINQPAYQIASMTRTGFHVELSGVPYPGGGLRLKLRRGNYSPNSPKIRGLFYTIPSATGNATIVVPGLAHDPLYLNSATAQQAVYDLSKITQVSFIKRTHRKRGAFVGSVRRGRQTARSSISV